MGEHTTESMNVEAGVIQGSVLGLVLLLLFIADLDNYLPPRAETEKCADEIISLIISTNTTTKLPQKIKDGVQLWCLDNRMRLNSENYKVMHFRVNKTNLSIPIVLGSTTLDVFSF